MPRFPSRDLADRFAGNRGYIHRPDRIRRAWTWLALAGLSLSLGWAAFELLAPSRAAYVHTHGPLADPHAALEGTCAACHRGHRPDEFGPGSVFHARERWRDLTCEGCHAGPAHHARADAAGRAFHDGCGNCHHDHGGRANSLVRIGDEHCTNCHADLPAHTADGTTRFAPRVTNFATDHPEFRARREAGAKPPAGRALKFSHPLHLTPGLVGRDARGRPWTLARIADEPARARYRKPGQSDSDPVTLDCASCHRLDGAPPGEFPGGSLPVRAAGDYHLPVRFDAHCRACHPIRVPEASLPGTRIDGFPVPHGKQPGELRTILAGRYARAVIEAGPPGEPGPTRLALRDEVNRLTAGAMGALLGGADGGCRSCHEVAGPPAAGREPGIATAGRPVRFPGAHFDHTSHRAVTCATCHPGAEAGGNSGSEPVPIPGIDSCRQCHSPLGPPVEWPGGVRAAGGGVRHGCTDCHRYHNGDHPLQGRGARARDPLAPLSLEEFLRGRRD